MASCTSTAASRGVAARAATAGVSTCRQHICGAPILRSAGLRLQRAAPRTVAVNAMLPGSDPSFLDHLAAHATPLFSVADAAVADAIADKPERVTGPLTPLANAMEGVLQALDQGLEAAHVPYSYGFAIITLTILVKAATFPLSKKQIESTNAMQQLQPRVKELQERYKGDQERLQMETARLYKEAGVNPLAGCLPTLATIPVFIGLYRALSNAADDGLLTDGFFWIPSLGGPTTIAARNAGTGNAWLFPFVDGHPPIGWHDAGAYLVLPVLLVISQSLSQKIMQPAAAKSDDPAQQQTQAILKFLPLMIGWFSLNVPSGLTLYWFTNNILTTAQSVYLRRFKSPAVEALTTDIPMGSTTIVKDKTQEKKKEKKSKGKDTGARRKKGDKFKAIKEAEMAQKGGSPKASADKPKKGDKFRAIKAAESTGAGAAAAKAAELAGDSTAAPAEPVEVEIVGDSEGSQK